MINILTTKQNNPHIEGAIFVPICLDENCNIFDIKMFMAGHSLNDDHVQWRIYSSPVTYFI